MPTENVFHDSKAMIDEGLHCFISPDKFESSESPSSVLRGHISVITINQYLISSWKQTKRVVETVHLHTCSHSTYSYIHTLL